MWLDDELLDPDSEAGRERMMAALDAVEAEHIFAAPLATKHEMPAHATGHTYHSGPPRLICSVPWGLMLLREAEPSHPALVQNAAGLAALDSESELSVHVDWQDLTAELVGLVRLSVRHKGAVVAEAAGGAPQPLCVTFSVAGACAGDVYLASLTWDGGSRHLHCLAPLHAPVKLDGLAAMPAAALPTATSLLAADRSAVECPITYLPNRAIGIELELITLA